MKINYILDNRFFQTSRSISIMYNCNILKHLMTTNNNKINQL